jgi:hypothetical protein
MAMALTAGELCEIVWGETNALGVGRADGGGEVNAVRALVARLAAATQGVGFPRRTPLPRTDDARSANPRARSWPSPTPPRTPSNRSGASSSGLPERIPARSRLEPIRRRLSPGTRSPPAPAVANQFHTQLPASGKLVDVFSRGALAGDADGRPFVNALTGTGLPGGAPLAATAPPPQTPIASWIPWTLGIVGVVLFGGGAAALTGASLGAARNSLHATAPAYQKFMLEDVGKACLKTNADFPGAALPKVCDGILTTDNKAIDNDKLSANRSDQEHGSAAASYVFTALSWASGYLTGLQRDVGVASIVTPYLCSLAGGAALLVALGLGTKGRASGSTPATGFLSRARR